MHPDDLIRIGQQHLDDLRHDADHRRLLRRTRHRQRPDGS